MDDSKELTLKDILDSLNTPDPDTIDKSRLLDDIYKYHEKHPRYHYREISNYVIEKDTLEEIEVISENLKRLMKWMEEQSRDIPCPLSIHECDMVRSLSRADILSCQIPTLRKNDVLPGIDFTCNQFKETYHVIDVIYDHIQLEYGRSVLIQDHSERLENQYKEIEGNIIDKINSLKDKERDLYLQIVTILGIFTSIVIAFFGGFGTITGLISSIDNLSDITGVCFSVSLLVFTVLSISSAFILLLKNRYIDVYKDFETEKQKHSFVGTAVWIVYMIAEAGSLSIVIICLLAA